MKKKKRIIRTRHTHFVRACVRARRRRPEASCGVLYRLAATRPIFPARRRRGGPSSASRISDRRNSQKISPPTHTTTDLFRAGVEILKFYYYIIPSL